MTLELRAHADGVMLRVRVQPGAKRSALLGTHNGALKIAVAAPPVDGKANEAVLAFLRDLFGLKRSQLSLSGGEKSRDKTVKFTAVTAEEIRAKCINFSGATANRRG